MNTYLYKYRAVNQDSLEILINRALYLSNTRQFNDPFDGQLLPSDFISELEVLGYPVGEQEISVRDNFIKDRIHGYGILSLSRVCNNILMWSHYADAHKGFCLGFKYDLSQYFDDHDWPIDHKLIKYSHDHPFKEIHDDLILNRRFNTNDGFLNACELSSAIEDATFTVKHSSWSHEEEERIISHVAGIHSFRAKALDHVVFGLHITKRDELTLRSLLNTDQWKHVRFFRAHRGKAALSLDIQEE